MLEQLTPIYLDISSGVAEFTPPPEESRALIRQGALRSCSQGLLTCCTCSVLASGLQGRCGCWGATLFLGQPLVTSLSSQFPLCPSSRAGYNVARNLLLRFADDTIDETPALASTLQTSAVGNTLELTVKTLAGDHVRPLQQDLTGISPDLVRLANQATQTAVSQSESLLGQLGAFAARAGLPEETTSQLSSVFKAGTQLARQLGTAMVSVDAEEQIEALADEIGTFCGLPPAAPGQVQPVRALPPPPAAAT